MDEVVQDKSFLICNSIGSCVGKASWMEPGRRSDESCRPAGSCGLPGASGRCDDLGPQVRSWSLDVAMCRR
eukprot:748402-Hanusia_phi.AAC.4